MTAADFIVIAKEPVPGRVKTRLTPAYTPAEAAALAEAALRDTLTAVAAAPADRRPSPSTARPARGCPPGSPFWPSSGGGLDERLAAAFADARAGRPSSFSAWTPRRSPRPPHPRRPGPGTPRRGARARRRRRILAARAAAPDARLLRGVPMSRPDTGTAQLARLRGAGLDVGFLPRLTDADTPADARAVAAAAHGSRFAAALRGLGARPVPA